MATGTNGVFDPKAFLASVGKGRNIIKAREGEVIFSQGDPADALFYLQNGKVKVTTLSSHGKEAVVAILGAGDFFGEGCLAGQPLRISTVAAMADSSVARLQKAAVIRLLHDEPAFRRANRSALCGSCLAWSTQIAVRAATTSVRDCASAIALAVPPVTQPPQEKPTIASGDRAQAAP